MAGVLIEGGALEPVRRLLPAVTEAQQADLLARQCRLYNHRGIGVVRDPGLMPGEVAVYEAVTDRRELTTRTRLIARRQARRGEPTAPGAIAWDVSAETFSLTGEQRARDSYLPVQGPPVQVIPGGPAPDGPGACPVPA
jgi:hypothetical protein